MPQLDRWLVFANDAMKYDSSSLFFATLTPCAYDVSCKLMLCFIDHLDELKVLMLYMQQRNMFCGQNFSTELNC